MVSSTHRGSDRVASFDEAAAAEFGRIASVLAERGTPIGEFDVLIAAHAVTLRCTLVTNNIRHFSKVPALRWKTGREVALSNGVHAYSR